MLDGVCSSVGKHHPVFQVAAPRCIPNSCERVFPTLHVLTSVWCRQGSGFGYSHRCSVVLLKRPVNL